MRIDLQKVRFPAHRPFHADLKRRVEDYFEGAARSRHGGWAMGVKSAAMLGWLGISYAVLMFAHVRVWEAALLTLSIGLAMAGVGFSVMHDANHGGTSSSARTNGILSFTLDLIGGSSFLWRRKHNVLHHTYTNISALDPDLEGGGLLLRLAPWQPRHGQHRFQHLYVWLLYGVFPLKWWFVDDFRELVTGRIGGHQFAPARGFPLLGGGNDGAFIIQSRIDEPIRMQDYPVLMKDPVRSGYANFMVVDGNYFDAMNIGILAGRAFRTRREPRSICPCS